MAKKETCKTKDCDNPVLDGKYCEHCKQVRKETRGKVYKVTGGAAIPVAGVVAKTGAWRKIPEIAVKIARLFLKK